MRRLSALSPIEWNAMIWWYGVYDVYGGLLYGMWYAQLLATQTKPAKS